MLPTQLDLMEKNIKKSRRKNDKNAARTIEHV